MGERYEYRLTWKRRHPGLLIASGDEDLPLEGGPFVYTKRKRYDSFAGARRFALLVQGRQAEAFPDHDPEGYMCCGGYECGCGGVSWAEHWEAENARIVKKYGPVVSFRIDRRPVGDWAEANHLGLKVSNG